MNINESKKLNDIINELCSKGDIDDAGLDFLITHGISMTECTAEETSPTETYAADSHETETFINANVNNGSKTKLSDFSKLTCLLAEPADSRRRKIYGTDVYIR